MIGTVNSVTDDIS